MAHWRLVLSFLLLFAVFPRLAPAQFRTVAIIPGGRDTYFNPMGGLTLSGDRFYIPSERGGSLNYGTVASIRIDGSDYRLLHEFGPEASRFGPQGELFVEGDYVFGSVNSFSRNSVFRMRTDGSDYQIIGQLDLTIAAGLGAAYGRFEKLGDRIYNVIDNDFVFSFDTTGADFQQAPVGQQLFPPWRGSDFDSGLTAYNGFLYGTTWWSLSADQKGRFFRIDPDLTGYVELGQVPQGSFGELLLVGDRFFGTIDYGLIYSLRPDGTDYTLHHAVPGPSNQFVTPLTRFGDRLYGFGNATPYLYSVDLLGGDFRITADFTPPTGAVSVFGIPTLIGDTLYGTMTLTNQQTLIFAYTVPEPAALPLANTLLLAGLSVGLVRARTRSKVNCVASVDP